MQIFGGKKKKVSKESLKSSNLLSKFIKVWLLRAPHEFISDMSVLKTQAILLLNPGLQLLGRWRSLAITSNLKYREQVTDLVSTRVRVTGKKGINRMEILIALIR